MTGKKNSRSIHTSPHEQQLPCLFIPYSPSSVPSAQIGLDVTDGFLFRFVCRPSLCRVSTSAVSREKPIVAWMWAQTKARRRYPVRYVCLGSGATLLGHPSLPPSPPPSLSRLCNRGRRYARASKHSTVDGGVSWWGFFPEGGGRLVKLATHS